LLWIKHYLTDRKQRVAHSKWRTIKAIMLNNDMAINAWSTKWLVNCNPKKTEIMTITIKINKPFHPPLIMNNTLINQVTEVNPYAKPCQKVYLYHKKLRVFIFLRLKLFRIRL
jgi:hypothetical protein